MADVTDTVRRQYRELSDSDKQALDAIKVQGQNFLATLVGLEPLVAANAGREFALARIKIEEAVMWAVKGITKYHEV